MRVRFTVGSGDCDCGRISTHSANSLACRQHYKEFEHAEASDRCAASGAEVETQHQAHNDRLNSPPINELSGGQRQRALLAQGLAQQAPTLLLDEPAAGLDSVSQGRILEVIRAEAKAGKTVLFSTNHLPDTAYADTVVALSCHCVCCASPSTALANPKVTALFEAKPDDHRLLAARV